MSSEQGGSWYWDCNNMTHPRPETLMPRIRIRLWTQCLWPSACLLFWSACECVFMVYIADLLDESIPGSSGTSHYIRAVYQLIQPFRVPNFGSPEDVQKSLSCAITIFCLWKKVLELKKLSLHSKPGAKQPAKAQKICHLWLLQESEDPLLSCHDLPTVNVPAFWASWA